MFQLVTPRCAYQVRGRRVDVGWARADIRQSPKTVVFNQLTYLLAYFKINICSSFLKTPLQSHSLTDFRLW